MRLSGRTEVTAVDLAPYVHALPAVLAELRALTFVDGKVRHPVTGTPHEGLQLVTGVHPCPGAVYRLVIREELVPEPTPEEAIVTERLGATDPEAARDWERGRVAAARASGQVDVKWHRLVVTLADDDARRTALDVRDEPDEARARIDVRDSGRIDTVLELVDLAPASVLVRGAVQVLMRLEAARLPPFVDQSPQLVATVSHRRVRIHVDVRFAAVAADRWAVTTDVDARGAGWWARPLVALTTPFLRGPAGRELAAVMAALPAAFELFAAELLARRPDPAALVADAVSALPLTVP